MIKEKHEIPAHGIEFAIRKRQLRKAIVEYREAPSGRRASYLRALIRQVECKDICPHPTMYESVNTLSEGLYTSLCRALTEHDNDVKTQDLARKKVIRYSSVRVPKKFKIYETPEQYLLVDSKGNMHFRILTDPAERFFTDPSENGVRDTVSVFARVSGRGRADLWKLALHDGEAYMPLVPCVGIRLGG